jgi:hypothetical protein
MRRNGIRILPIAIIIILTLSLAVMLLWNALLPSLFGFSAINYLQAIGLLLLSRILFGGFGHFGLRHNHHNLREHWHNLSPEDREKIKIRGQHLFKHGFGHSWRDEQDETKERETSDLKK